MLQVSILPTTDQSLEKVTLADVLLDPEDEWILDAASWHITCDGYVGGRINGEYVLLQHIIIERPPEGWVSDHKNRVRHDYRKENLRYASRTGNKINTEPESCIRTLPSGRYNVRVRFENKRVGLGTYDTYEEAEKARDAYKETLDVERQYQPHNGRCSREMELLKAARLSNL